MKKNKILIKANASCWCCLCNKKIMGGKKNPEPYLYIWRNAWRGSTRANICIVCIEKVYKEINKKKLKEVKKEYRKWKKEEKLRRVVEEI